MRKVRFFSCTDARVFYNRDIYKELFFFVKRLGLDKKHIRIATSKKVPIEKGWTGDNYQEKRSIEQLVKEYQEYGARTGTKVGNLFFEVLDIDIDRDHVPFSLRGRWRINFELLMERKRVSYIRTARGYQVYLLLEELSPNSTVYHQDKFGKKRIAGSVLSKGRQAQELGSPDKEPAGKGKWAWQAKNIEAIAEIFGKYFFSIECKEKPAQKEVSNINQKSSENISKNPYKFLKLENIRITSKQITKRENHYRVSYLDKWQNSG